MFHSITLKNYRTHIDSTIRLGKVTLLLGNNNAGKTNLLNGIRHFSQLIARANPEKERPQQTVASADFFPHRHRLSKPETPVEFSCEWSHSSVEVAYTMSLRENRTLPNEVAVSEQIYVNSPDAENLPPFTMATGADGNEGAIVLRERIFESPHLPPSYEEAARRFFRDVAQAFAYHFQPAHLKGLVPVKWPAVDPQRLVVPSQLGHEGANLIEIVRCYPTSDESAYNRFVASLRRFFDKFHTVRIGREGRLIWEFDLGGDGSGRLDSFDTSVVSDGLLKAAAVALLTTVAHPPALILLEEIENGVNPANIEEFLSWIQQATVDPKDAHEWRTQFILTTHSPAVLREFYDQLENVYTVKLHRKGFRSDVRNLSESLDTLIGLGAVDGEIIQSNGSHKVVVTQKDLVDLWFSGTIG